MTPRNAHVSVFTPEGKEDMLPFAVVRALTGFVRDAWPVLHFRCDHCRGAFTVDDRLGELVALHRSPLQVLEVLCGNCLCTSRQRPLLTVVDGGGAAPVQGDQFTQPRFFACDMSAASLAEREETQLRAYLAQHALPAALWPLLSAALLYGKGYDHPEGFAIFDPATLASVNERIGEACQQLFREVMQPDYRDAEGA